MNQKFQPIACRVTPEIDEINWNGSDVPGPSTRWTHHDSYKYLYRFKCEVSRYGKKSCETIDLWLDIDYDPKKEIERHLVELTRLEATGIACATGEKVKIVRSFEGNHITLSVLFLEPTPTR